MNLTLEVLLIGALIGALTAYLAKGRGRDPFIWFFIGMLFGIFGLIALYIVPSHAAEEEPPPEVEVYPDTAYDQHDWFYLDKERKSQGPFSFQDFKEEYNKENFTLIWNETFTEWKKLSDLPEIMNRLND